MPRYDKSTININELGKYILVIAEKPKAAQKIAEALSASKKLKINGVPIWITNWNGLTHVIAPAAGHLFTLSTNDRGYPTFNFMWVPRYVVDRNARFSKKFFDVLRMLSKYAVGFINACDYDIEGSLIGFMIIKQFGDVRNAKRAKFSSLTSREIQRAFLYLEDIDYNMVEAGYCRHVLDWLWGVNISRMLMDFYRKVFGKNIVLSAGRVQTPTLAHAVDIILSRRWHVPIPYAVIDIKVKLGDKVVKLEYSDKPLESLETARRIANEIKQNPYAIVEKVVRNIKTVDPPHPFNLPDLQAEAYRIYKVSPYKTQKIAEELYLEALISYPRTNSQKLPTLLDNKEILNKLALNIEYRKLVKEILNETGGVLKPNNGPMDDPAHPAIYPTGEKPKALKILHKKIYDLIVRRYIATFAKPLRVTNLTLTISVNGLQYTLSIAKVLEPGWLKYYPFFSYNENQFLLGYEIFEGMMIPIEDFTIRVYFTKPVPPPTKISLLKWMESVNIGTEATRAEIIELLFRRGYVLSKSRSIDASDVGLLVVHLLRKYVQELVSIDLTRSFEEKLRVIRNGELKCDEVIREAIKVLTEHISNVTELERDLEREVFKIIPIQSASTENHCIICKRAVDEKGFCMFHHIAYEKILKGYEKWKTFNFNWHEYLRKLIKLKSTGVYVKEVAEYLLKNACLPCNEPRYFN
jgi:DNA topoisomerase-1